MRTRTLITGGAGFIGSHLAARSVAAGEDVHILARPSTSLHRLAALQGRITVHRADLGDAAALTAAIDAAQPQRVFHLAADTRPQPGRSAPDIAATAIAEVRNLLLFLQLLDRPGHRPERLIRGGTIAEYGRVATPYREDSAVQPETPYGRAMAAGTDAIKRLAPLIGYPVIAARLALVYGPHQAESFMIPAMIRDCLARRPFTVKRPEDRRDLIHIDDVVDALGVLGAAPLPSASVVNISTGIAPTMREAADRIIALTGADPSSVTFGGPQLPDDISDLCSSAERAARLLGWTARTSLADGLQKTVAWAREHCLTEA